MLWSKCYTGLELNGILGVTAETLFRIHEAMNFLLNITLQNLF